MGPPGGQRLVSVGDMQDAGQQAYLPVLKPLRISRAVEALMVLLDRLDDFRTGGNLEFGQNFLSLADMGFDERLVRKGKPLKLVLALKQMFGHVALA